MRDKSRNRLTIVLSVLSAVMLTLGNAQAGNAQQTQSPKTDKNAVPRTDANQVNNTTVRFDGYFKRFPHAKQAQMFDKLTDYTEHGRYGVKIGPHEEAGTGDGDSKTITIQPGQLLMQKSKGPQFGDTKVHFRPQYRALIVPCGSPTGHFTPQPGSLPGCCGGEPQTILMGGMGSGGGGGGGGGSGGDGGTESSNCSSVQQARLGCIPPPLQAVPIIWASSTETNSKDMPHPVVVGAAPGEIPCYVQPWLSNNNKSNIAQARDEEVWEYELTTFGVGPISDTQFQMIDREDNQRFLELMFDPERWMWVGRATKNIEKQQMGESLAEGSESSFHAAVLTMKQYLINVANENAAQPVSGNPPSKTIPQAIYMIQQMYKQVFTPMAILFLLPGALLTQMKGMVNFGVLRNPGDEDATSPFSGILRAMIAVFLIPATQLIVSYLIDVGNSMTYEVQKYVDVQQLFKNTDEQTYNAPRPNARNVVLPTPKKQDTSDKGQMTEENGTGQPELQEDQNGKHYEIAEEHSEVEKQTNLSMIIQWAYNGMNFLMSQALIVLCLFQLVMMSYLFLMGPVAASLFAWPGSIGKDLFRRVFATWLDAVTILALWRFWWMVILACMCTRISWLKEAGAYTPNSQWEMMMFTCFVGLLMYVPFQPFEFRPGETAAAALQQGASAMKGAAQSMGQAAQSMGGASASPAAQQAAAQMKQTASQMNFVADSAAAVSGGMYSGLRPESMPTTNSYGSGQQPPPSSSGQSMNSPMFVPGAANPGLRQASGGGTSNPPPQTRVAESSNPSITGQNLNSSVTPAIPLSMGGVGGAAISTNPQLGGRGSSSSSSSSSNTSNTGVPAAPAQGIAPAMQAAPPLTPAQAATQTGGGAAAPSAPSGSGASAGGGTTAGPAMPPPGTGQFTGGGASAPAAPPSSGAGAGNINVPTPQTPPVAPLTAQLPPTPGQAAPSAPASSPSGAGAAPPSSGGRNDDDKPEPPPKTKRNK